MRCLPQRIGLVAVLAGAALLMAFGVAGGVGPALAEETGTTPDAWEKRMRAAESSAARWMKGVADWCKKRKLLASARRYQAVALRFRPDDAKLRKALGYVQSEGGTWTRPPLDLPALHKRLIDPAGAARLKLRARERTARAKAAELFRGLGRSADTMVRRGREVEYWQRNSTQAWDRVLELVSQDATAIRALGGPLFDGRPVSHYALPFLKERKARNEAGRELAVEDFATSTTRKGGYLTQSGLDGGSARSEHFTLSSTYGAAAAEDMLQWAERAYADAMERYALPTEILPHFRLRHFVLVRSRRELEAVTRHTTEWSEARIQKYLKQFGGFWLSGSTVVSRENTLREAIDTTIHYVARSLVRGIQRYGNATREKDRDRGVEPWLLEGLASDVAIRLTGQSLSNFVTMRRYAHEKRDFEGGNRWIERAREQVEMDLDVPLATLPSKSLRLLGEPETLKAYAFLQFLFEKEPLEAQEFFLAAVLRGSAAAVKDVYGVSFARLDAQFRRWILRTW